MGVGRGVGTTHFSLLLANCLANGLKVRAAVVEYNGHNAYFRILKESGGVQEHFGRFTYAGIDFYRTVGETELSEVLAAGYDVVIMDMQYGQKNVLREFLRSNIRIIVAGLNLWQSGELKTFLKNEKLSPAQYLCVSHSYDKHLAKAIEKEYGMTVKAIPMEQNPFAVSAEGFMEILQVAGF